MPKPASLVPFLLLAACATPSNEAPGAGEAASAPPTSLTLVIQSRDEVGLSDAQVARLIAEDEELRARNAPLWAELQRVLPAGAGRRGAMGGRGAGRRGGPGGGMGGGMGGGRRGGRGDGSRGGRGAGLDPQKAQEALGILDRIEDADRAAYAAVEPLLDDAQKQKADEIVAARREQVRRSRARLAARASGS